ncbi:MAG: lipoprotein-releasing ABC transporter permease subunit [bacterium]
MNYKLFIAMRYIKSRKKGVFALLTTVIAISGVTLGVASLIITLSVMNGFKDDIQKKILGTQSELVLTSRTNKKIDINNVIVRLERFPEVIAASPFVYGQGILKMGSANVGSVVKGILPDYENKTTRLSKQMEKGNLESLDAKGSKNIVLGFELAKNLGVDIGNEVVLVSPHAIATPFGNLPQMAVFNVSGIFHVGMYEFDANLAYISLAEAQKMFNYNDSVSGFGIKIENIYNAQKMAERLSFYMGYDYWVRSWIEMNRNLFSALKLEKIVMFIILTLIILVAAFNIISNLFLLTMEKYRDIGVLRALGAKILDIKKIFIFEGLITGGLGILFGSVLGVVVSLLLDRYKFIKLPADVYYIDTLPVKLLWGDLAVVTVVALIIAFFSTIYPAQKAAKIDPVEAIRYG